jgi:hypothetical protein
MEGEHMARSTGRRVWRIFAGGFLGFAAYCSLVVLRGVSDLIFRGYFDGEGVVKECVLPFVVVVLFSKDTWRSGPLWVNLQILFGVMLILIGIRIGAWKGSSQESQPVREARGPDDRS